MNDIPAATKKKIQTLAQIAADLRQGKDFNITRLTILKSLCAVQTPLPNLHSILRRGPSRR